MPSREETLAGHLRSNWGLLEPDQHHHAGRRDLGPEVGAEVEGGHPSHRPACYSGTHITETQLSCKVQARHLTLQSSGKEQTEKLWGDQEVPGRAHS